MHNIVRTAAVALVVLANASASSPAAEDGNGTLLRGKAAVGSWQQDKSGIRRLLTPRDLPPTGKSTPNFSEVAPMPAGAKARVPSGFSVEMVASGLANPRSIRLAPNGDLFVADSASNTVRVLRIPAGSASPTQNEVFTRFAAPGLMAGNAAVMKLSSNVPGCALAIERVFQEAGFPRDLFRNLMTSSARVEAAIENPLVRAATLTGSGPAGRAVAGKAGSLLKKTVLELGGSDPYLVLEDADLDLAATVCARGRLINSGQSCIAAKRFIVVDKVQDRFVERFVERMAAAKMGDPLSQDSEIGPQARHDLRDALHQQVENSAATVRAACSAVRSPNDPGAYYPPTVLTNVRKGMPAYDEELFGPVASVIRIDNEDAAIATANDSIFGLSGGVITRDIARGERIAAEIESGCVFVNDNVRSDPRLPFGGVKESGYGRELSHYGIKEFVNIKTIVVS